MCCNDGNVRSSQHVIKNMSLTLKLISLIFVLLSFQK